MGGTAGTAANWGAANWDSFTWAGASSIVLYFTVDHLGSIAVIADSNGTVNERDSYDAWGKRRDPTGTDRPACTITSETTRGFTGQEMMDTVCAVNLNARIYDPTIARFLAADPITATPYDLQSINRYAYVENAPLTKTDPTGFCADHGPFALGDACLQAYFLPSKYDSNPVAKDSLQSTQQSTQPRNLNRPGIAGPSEEQLMTAKSRAIAALLLAAVPQALAPQAGAMPKEGCAVSLKDECNAFPAGQARDQCMQDHNDGRSEPCDAAMAQNPPLGIARHLGNDPAPKLAPQAASVQLPSGPASLPQPVAPPAPPSPPTDQLAPPPPPYTPPQVILAPPPSATGANQ